MTIHAVLRPVNIKNPLYIIQIKLFAKFFYGILVTHKFTDESYQHEFTKWEMG